MDSCRLSRHCYSSELRHEQHQGFHEHDDVQSRQTGTSTTRIEANKVWRHTTVTLDYVTSYLYRGLRCNRHCQRWSRRRRRRPCWWWWSACACPWTPSRPPSAACRTPARSRWTEPGWSRTGCGSRPWAWWSRWTGSPGPSSRWWRPWSRVATAGGNSRVLECVRKEAVE